MNKVVNVSLRIVGTLLAATVASYLGFIVSGMAVQHWYVTHATKELHSDGQAGLGTSLEPSMVAARLASLCLPSEPCG